jgi:hypothetical protein
MNSIADGSVIIQATARSVPSTPSWFGEVVVLIEHLRKQGVLAAISERVRFARRRCGHYEGSRHFFLPKSPLSLVSWLLIHPTPLLGSPFGRRFERTMPRTPHPPRSSSRTV